MNLPQKLTFIKAIKDWEAERTKATGIAPLTPNDRALLLSHIEQAMDALSNKP